VQTVISHNITFVSQLFARVRDKLPENSVWAGLLKSVCQSVGLMIPTATGSLILGGAYIFDEMSLTKKDCVHAAVASAPSNHKRRTRVDEAFYSHSRSLELKAFWVI